MSVRHAISEPNLPISLNIDTAESCSLRALKPALRHSQEFPSAELSRFPLLNCVIGKIEREMDNSADLL